MRVLLDHCVDKRFAAHLPGHHVRTARQELLDAIRDPILLRRATGRFDVIVTVDQRLVWQTSPHDHSGIGLIVIRVGKNKIGRLLPFVPRILAAIDAIRPGEVVTLSEET